MWLCATSGSGYIWVFGAKVSIEQRSLQHEALLQVHACALECHVVGLLGRVHHGGGVSWA